MLPSHSHWPPGRAVTEREAVLRERKAFEAGAMWVASSCYTGPQSLAKMAADNRTQRAREVYPLPVRRRPIRVELSDGTKWGLHSVRYAGEENSSAFWLYDDGLKSLPPSMVDFRLLRMHAQTPADFEAIARMLDGEMEDAPEDE